MARLLMLGLAILVATAVVWVAWWPGSGPAPDAGGAPVGAAQRAETAGASRVNGAADVPVESRPQVGSGSTGPSPATERQRTLDRHGARLSISGRLSGAEQSVAEVTIHIAESAEVTDADFVGVPRATERAATGQHPVWVEYQIPDGGHRSSAIRLLELRPGEPVDLELDLEPSRDLRGRLQVAGGALAVGAEVWVQPCCPAGQRLLAVGPPLRATLESNGEFVASRLPSAWVNVWVEAPRLQHDAVEDTRRCVEVLFEDSAQAPAWAGGLERPVVDLRSGDGYLVLHLR